MKNAQKPLFFERITKRWSRSPLTLFALIVGLAVGSCGPTHQLPPREEVITRYKDSTILHILDSVRVTEATRYKDWAGLLDTLILKTADGSVTSRAYCDTSRNILAGELDVKPRQEKTRIVYKDRVVQKDSLVFKEIPVEVEVPVKYIPKWTWWSLAISVLSILFFGIKVYLKFKTRFLK